MKLTEESLNLVIDILNDLICEGKMLNDVERRSLLNAVMAITAVRDCAGIWSAANRWSGYWYRPNDYAVY